MVSLQLVFVPVHPPLQPLKVEPGSAFTFRVTFAPWLYGAEQVEPQLIPAGELVTVPLPDPSFAIVRVYCWVAPASSVHVIRQEIRIKDKSRGLFLLMGQTPFLVLSPRSSRQKDNADPQIFVRSCTAHPSFGTSVIFLKDTPLSVPFSRKGWLHRD